jgi:hypothetical protein
MAVKNSGILDIAVIYLFALFTKEENVSFF